MQSNLHARHEFVELEAPQCPRCGMKLKLFPGTEDAEVLEIEVKAYRRVIPRRRYAAVCRCGCLPGIVGAPLFKPIGQALMAQLRSEQHWHSR